jgi:hypothetical protein
MYTHDQMLELISVAKAAKLSFPDEFAAAPLDELCEVCNGVGSASIPEKLRKALTKAYACAQATAAIHDWRYSKSDGLPDSQRKADAEFLKNGMEEVKYRHANGGLLSLLRRLWDERKIVVAYRFLEADGESAWCISFRNNVLKLN